jgi:hypothetical protein
VREVLSIIDEVFLRRSAHTPVPGRPEGWDTFSA